MSLNVNVDLFNICKNKQAIVSGAIMITTTDTVCWRQYTRM